MINCQSSFESEANPDSVSESCRPAGKFGVISQFDSTRRSMLVPSRASPVRDGGRPIACRGQIMRWTAIAIAGGMIPLAGCQLTHMAAHNLLNEPIQYLDEKKVTDRLRDDAEAVLREWEQQNGGPVSDDFEDGFVDGYADYLERGGNAVPPAVPPLKYRRGRFLNPDGHARIHDYFAGFQAGADTAAQSGRRQFLTVPILVPDPQPIVQPNARQIPSELCAPNCGPQPTLPGETLPPPRALNPVTTGLPAPSRPLASPPDLPSVVVPEVKSEQPLPAPLEHPPPEVPAPTSDIPVSAPPPPGFRAITTDGSSPGRDVGGVHRTIVPPLRESPRKPGHSLAGR